MLDRKVRLASHQPDAAALEPPTCEARVKRQCTVDQHRHGGNVLAESCEHEGCICEDARIVAGDL